MDEERETTPTWQERVQKEYFELKERYENLHKMLVKIAAAEAMNKPYEDILGFRLNCSKYLLEEQANCMGSYLRILEIIAVIEGVEL